MDNEEIANKIKLFSERLRIQFDPLMIYLYGSYAKGNWHKGSDIDIAIILDKPLANHFETINKILKLRRNIDLRIEPVIFYYNIDPSGFLKNILDTGIRIYKRN